MDSGFFFPAREKEENSEESDGDKSWQNDELWSLAADTIII